MRTYPEAEKILEEIKKANKILLSLHISPDADSVGSNLALSEVLKNNFNKNVTIVSSDQVPGNLHFLEGSKNIIIQDPCKVNLKDFDLYIVLDSANTTMVSESEKFEIPKKLKVIVIDHHQTNTKYGQVNLIDGEIGSTGELLYNIFLQWHVELAPNTATALLTAIIGDTGGFRFATTKDTLKAAGNLVERGADLQTINFNKNQKMPLNTLRMWGMILSSLQKRQVGDMKFAWSALSFDSLKNIDESLDSSGITTVFFGGIDDTDFAFALIESKDRIVKGSIRARTDFDVSKIAELFGGGGHKAAAGFRVKIENSFEQTVNDILEKIEKYLEKL